MHTNRWYGDGATHTFDHMDKWLALMMIYVQRPKPDIIHLRSHGHRGGTAGSARCNVDRIETIKSIKSSQFGAA